MSAIKITLHPGLQQDDSNLLARYLHEPHRLSRQEWRALMRAIDLLGGSHVLYQDQLYTFHQFYQQMVDHPHSGPFLDQLYEIADVEREGQQLWATKAREITAWLRQVGFRDDQTDYAGYLVVYCLYWWSAFSHGYIFELAIFRDLQASGINFSPHDPRLRIQNTT